MKTKKKLFEKIINIVLTIAIVICCFFIGFKLTFISVVVSGDSMNPTFEDGAKGYMVKVNENSKIERFDVVACIYNNSTNNYIIKRVLGLPNETIELKDNQLYVNNEIIQQDFSFISQDIDFALSTWTLQENQYLLVGDNRNGTMAPFVAEKSAILAKNGFSYATADVNDECRYVEGYASCPIKHRKWYLFKDGQ